MNFGDKIKQLRLEKSWTQEFVANKLNVSMGALSRYETGMYEPKSLDLVKDFSNLFEVSVDYLLGNSKFKTKEEELENYLNTEIKNDLILDLKKLELDKPDLEKAITAFIENYMIISDNPSVDIYNMEDSLIYYAYELIAKYYFKLINKELSILTNNSDLLIDKQAFFDMAEESAWGKMKGILENIDENKIISDLTAQQKVDNLLSKLNAKTKYYMCPVYGQISAGQPNWVEECIEGRIPLDPDLMGIVNPEEHFFLRVNGESMNKVIRNGAFALIHKQDMVDDGEIAVVLVNGDNATLKRFTRKGDIVVLEPDSDDPEIKTQIYDKTTPIKILGKYVGKMEINK